MSLKHVRALVVRLSDDGQIERVWIPGLLTTRQVTTTHAQPVFVDQLGLAWEWAWVVAIEEVRDDG